MKAVMISIHPKWVGKIVIGEKTIEARKSSPKLETPFKCYIYCTKPDIKSRVVIGCMAYYNDELYRTIDGKIKYGSSIELMACPPESYSRDNFLNGKVIGEFVCDKIEKLEEDLIEGGLYYTLNSEFNEQAMLDNWELSDYGKGKTLYGWHISDLKIYDKPKPLSCFQTPKAKCEHISIYGLCLADSTNPPCEEIICNAHRLTHPPQSWQYIEVPDYER